VVWSDGSLLQPFAVRVLAARVHLMSVLKECFVIANSYRRAIEATEEA